jgi:hypothetical protein
MVRIELVLLIVVLALAGCSEGDASGALVRMVTPTPAGRCRGDQDCEPGEGCEPPDAPPACGTCQNVESNCATDADCTGAEVCGPAMVSCACAPARLCQPPRAVVPAAPAPRACTTDADCGADYCVFRLCRASLGSCVQPQPVAAPRM